MSIPEKPEPPKIVIAREGWCGSAALVWCVAAIAFVVLGMLL